VFKISKAEELEKLAQVGRPVFPFIDQGKDLGYMRERGKEEREKAKREEGVLELCRPPSPASGPSWPCRQ
jgi:hypothetical protein